MRFKQYSHIYDAIDSLNEMPHIEFQGQTIDLEAERHLIISRLIHIILGHKITDKYGSIFQLKKIKDRLLFIKQISSDSNVVKFLEKEVAATI